MSNHDPEPGIPNRFKIPCPVCGAAPGEDHVPQIDDGPLPDVPRIPNRPIALPEQRPRDEL